MRQLVAPLIVPPLLALLPAAPAHAAGTCQGQPATIESGDMNITGTEGPDVILATRAAHITALGGDDTICAAGGDVDAGAGNDSVLVYAYGGINTEEADLGPGVNRYASTEPVMLDYVTSGVPTEPNLDVIDTGGSADSVTVLLPGGSHPRVSGGTTQGLADHLEVRALPGDSAAWAVQLPSTVTRAGVPMGTFTDVSWLGLDLGQRASVSVHGTPGDDRLTVGAGAVDARLGAGADRVFLDPLHTVPASGRIDFGRGRDTLSYASGSRITLDLSTKAGLRIRHLETAVLAARKIRYHGGSGKDRVYAVGCRVELRGGPGNDRLQYADEDVRPSTPQCGRYRFRMFGQGGNDVMTGWRDRDVLIGGRGHDRADGRQDVDVCRAEVRVKCER